MSAASWRDVLAELRAADKPTRAAMLDRLSTLSAGPGISELDMLPYRWEAWGRDHQQMPTEEQWEVLFLCCGRGGGKTRTGAELTIEAVRDHDVGGHVALIAPVYADIATVMVEGESGILARSPPWFRPEWKPTKGYGGQIHWPNGVIGHCFTAEKPEQIRGVQFGWFWGDEIAKYDLDGGDGALVRSNIDFAHRLGSFLRGIFTSTPKPTPMICALEDEDRADLAEIEAGEREPGRRTTILRRWSTAENRENLKPEYIEKLNRKYAGTTKGREELDAEVIRDDPDALWDNAMIDAARIRAGDVPELVRVVVAVDNAKRKAKDGEIDARTVEGRNRNVGPNDTGIVVAGLGADGLYYVLGDWTINASPREWGDRVLAAFATAWPGRVADAVVVESNAGGDLIRSNLEVAMRHANVPVDLVPIREVSATDGKEARADPVVSLYEQGRVKHAANLPDLEFQQTRFKRGKTPYKKDRVDALVWAITSLISGPRTSPRERAVARAKAYTR